MNVLISICFSDLSSLLVVIGRDFINPKRVRQETALLGFQCFACAAITL